MNWRKKVIRGPKSHGNRVIDQKNFLYKGMKPKKKKLSYRRKKISSLGGSRTRDVHDRSLQTRRDAPVSIATRCIVGSSCNVYVRIIISNRPVTDYPKNWIYPPPTSVTMMVCPVWYLLYFILPTTLLLVFTLLNSHITN